MLKLNYEGNYLYNLSATFFLKTESLNVKLNQTGYLVVYTRFFLQLASLVLNMRL